MNRATTIALVFGYFRKNGFLVYTIKVDDFINIISKFIYETKISFGKNNVNIKIFSTNA